MRSPWNLCSALVAALALHAGGCEGRALPAPAPSVLTITRGTDSPVGGGVRAGAAGVVVLAVETALLEGSGAELQAVDVAVTGAPGAVAALTIAFDDVPEKRFGPVPLDANGVASFQRLGIAYESGQRRSFHVLADISNNAVAGDVFAVFFAHASGVVGQHGLATAGGAAGPPFDVRSTSALVVAPGPNNPGPQTVLSGTEVTALEVELAAAPSAVVLDALDIVLQGNAVFQDVVETATLFVDRDGDGTLDGNRDEVLAAAQAPGFGEETLRFEGLALVLATADAVHLAVALRTVPGTASGTSLGMRLASNEDVIAHDEATGGSLLVEGAPIVGGTITIDNGSSGIVVTTGPTSPDATAFVSEAADVSMLQAVIEASPLEPVVLTELHLVHSGSGDDEDIVRARVFVDEDRDGRASSTERQLGGSATFLGGEATFALGDGLSEPVVIDAGAALPLVVSFDFAELPTGRTFSARIPVQGARGRGARSSVQIVSTGEAVGAAFSSVGLGALTVAAGGQSPGATDEQNSSQGLPMTQVALTAGPNEDVLVSELVVRANGTLDDARGVDRVRLFLDENGDGALDELDVPLGRAQLFDADNGTATFLELDLVVPAGGRREVLVTYDLSGRGLPGESFSASVEGPSGVVARGLSSSAVLVPIGTAVGAQKTIQPQGSLVLAAGAGTSSASSESAAGVIEMVQLSLTTSAVEPVLLTSVVVRANGTADDVNDITAVRLSLDVDEDGRSSVLDVELGSAGFDGNNGTATFRLEEAGVILPAAVSSKLIVVYELAGTALPGQTLQALVSGVGAVQGVGLESGATIVASGSALGAVKTIQGRGTLALSVGANTPGSTSEPANATALPMLQFSLAASSVEDILVDAIVMRAAGTADDAALVVGSALWADDDADGLADLDAVPLATAGAFNSDNGTRTFTGLSIVVPRSEVRSFVITWDLSGDAVPGQTFQAAVVGAGIHATGVLSAAPISVSGVASGAAKQVQSAGSMSVFLGANTPGSSVVSADAAGLDMLQFTVATNQIEAIDVAEIDIRAGGTADDANAVAVTELYVDVDRDGHVGESDVLLASRAGFAEDNGGIAFRDLAITLPRSSQTTFLVRYDLSGGALPSQTLHASITPLSFVGVGQASRAEIVAGGSAAGATKTIQAAGTLGVATGSNSPGATVVAADSVFEVLQFVLTSNPVEAVRLTSIGLRVAGTLDDAVGVLAFELFADEDKDGRVGAVDRALATSSVLEDNGTTTFTVDEILPAASQTSFVVRVALSGAGLPAQTFSASVPAGAVAAVGERSRAPIVAGGSATGATKTLQNRGALTIAAGVRTPGAGIVSASATDVAVLQLQLGANAVEDIAVSSLVLRASGTMRDEVDVDSVRLFVDADANGTLSAPDAQLGGDASFDADNGTAVVADLGARIPANQTVQLLVVTDFAGTASGGETFAAAIANGLAVSARGITSDATITATGSVQGAAFTVRQNPLVVSEGPQNPGPVGVASDEVGVAVLQFVLAVPEGEDVTVDGITVTAAGTGNDSTGVAAATLVRDLDEDGVVSSLDIALGPTVSFAADNAATTFTGLGERLTGPASATYLVVYDLSGAALPNQTFQAKLANAAAVEATDARSQGAVLTGGTAVVGGLFTVVGETNFWTNLPTAQAPSGRTDHSAVAIDSRMLVFGGADARGVLGDGALFDTAAGTWRALPTTDAPNARSHHVGVALGARMLIWGGFDSGLVAQNTGAVFDATTETWTPTSSTGALSARVFPAVAVTRDRIFIFGGTTGEGGALNDGALYDPVTNAWEALPTAGRPTARARATAAFLPNRGAAGSVLVAGGFDGNATFFQNAFLFDLAAKTWSAAANAPAVFAAASATVVGNRVIMQGGQNTTGPVANAFQYDGTANAWRTLPSTGAPSARVGHTGVTINGRAIFFGGFSGTAPLATGGRYTPVTDLWSPTTAAGAPPARSGHTAVVVDGKMLIWGGLAENTYLNGGASYTP